MSNSYDLFMSKNDSTVNKINSNLLEMEPEIFFNTCFDKTQIKNLVSWFFNTYGAKKTIDFLEQLKYIGFHQATEAGISLGLDDLQIPPEKAELISAATSEMKKIEKQSLLGILTSVEKSQSLIDTWNQTSEVLRQNAVQNFKNNNVVNPVYMMAFSGARGNISQVRQLVAMRGLMADPQGAILEFPIQSNFREGLTITEYLISCYGARKGLVDTALRTATSGYLTRRLVDAAQHAVIALIDCSSMTGIKLIGKNLESRLIGRVLAKPILMNNKIIFDRNHIISTSSAKQISENVSQVFVRSPLTCSAQTTVCQMCYGWNLATGKLVTLGEAVGVIAAQSIGEPGTQLTMRTFHTGGVGVFSEQAMKPIFAPYSGQIEFIENIPGQFVRTPHGSIRYMVKYITKNPIRNLFRIRPLNNTDTEFLIKENEFPSGSLLVVKHGEFVQTGQLIGQASQLKLTKQKFPESSHPVYSPIEGQIFYESMNIRIQKEPFLSSNFSNDSINEFEFNQDKILQTNSGIPDIRTMTEIGSFWVLGTKNQYEPINLPSFIQRGDLVSPKTLLFQYNLYSPEQGQIKKVEKSLGLGFYRIQLPIQHLAFHKYFYKIIAGTNFKNTISDIFLYKRIQQKEFSIKSLIWHPNLLKISATDSVGYFYINPEYLQLGSNNIDNEDIITGKLISEYSVNNTDINKNTKGTIFWISQFIQKTYIKNLSIAYQIFGNCKTKKIGNFFYITQNNQKQLLFSISKQQEICKFEFKKYSNWRRNPQNTTTRSQFQNKIKFVSNEQKQIEQKFFQNSTNLYLQPKTGWLFIPTQKFSLLSHILKKPAVLKPGQPIFNNISFPNCYISSEYIPAKSIKNIKINKQKPNFKSSLKIWYQKETLLNSNLCFKEDYGFLKKQSSISPISQQLNRKSMFWFSNQICKLKTKKFKNKQSQILNLPICLVNFQKIIEHQLFTEKQLKYRWFELNQNLLPQNITNELFSKQFATKFNTNSLSIFDLQIQYPQKSDWLFPSNFLEINFIKPSTHTTENYFFYTALQKTWSGPEFKLFLYQDLTLTSFKNFNFYTFNNSWITPNSEFTRTYTRLQKFGEIIYTESKPNKMAIGVTVAENFKTVTINKATNFKNKIGDMIRWGDEIYAGFGSTINGQISKLSANNITIQLGMPFLASARGIIHIFPNELIQKNQLLITLKSRRLQTEDIVQGIPKIEQLFEARESQNGQILSDTVHTRLRSFFLNQLESRDKKNWSTAVEESFLYAQNFLVEGIIEAYSNQGVKISEKHVEVIVRQMTNRVRVLTGGDTGLLPGELIDHNWIKRFNIQLKIMGLREATYEPIVIGISKSVLQSDSFLLAASFQEVSRVLVKSSLSKKRDFLRGLHENVIVGQVVPAGTGLFSQTKFANSNTLNINNNQNYLSLQNN